MNSLSTWHNFMVSHCVVWFSDTETEFSDWTRNNTTQKDFPVLASVYCDMQGRSRRRRRTYLGYNRERYIYSQGSLILAQFAVRNWNG